MTIDPIDVLQEHLDGLLQEHEPSHPEVIETWTHLANLTGERGDPRGAMRRFNELGHTLREHLGPFDGKALDAYEGMARWAAGG
ncbi:hypothetical protein [Streptomyces sp. NPDC057552]|uniref:hypothetical protein n=1 Tax=Streptomyces sp. NPDC057552 TaxID=3350537 RepID=UPI0036BF261D